MSPNEQKNNVNQAQKWLFLFFLENIDPLYLHKLMFRRGELHNYSRS